jgi:hypothetical protein
MDRKRTLKRSNESGQSLLMLAVFLIGVLGMLALVLDGGSIYLVRRRMQNAADAGALAAARELALEHGEAAARTAAEEYAIYRNGADRADISFEDEGTTVWVTAHKDLSMSFAVILGIDEVTVIARAAAGTFGGIKETKGILAPIALYEPEDEIWYEYDPCCDEEDPDPPCPVTCEFTIWDDTTEDSDEGPWDGEVSGNLRGWSSPNCAGCHPADPECDPEDAAPSCGDAGADLLAEWMRHGYPGEVVVDSWMRGDNGVKTHPVAITATRVGEILIIPLFDDVEDLYPGKAYYHIKRLACFLVLEVIATGNPKGIHGRVVNCTVPGVIDPGLEGARTFRLIH